MEHIRQALEREKAEGVTVPKPLAEVPYRSAAPGATAFREVELDRAYIEARRIIAHQAADPRSKSFDMMRTQALQAMDQSHWQFLGITSPSPACGKTLTAVNLALSVSRQPERSVLLVDLDFHKPQVADCLGLKIKHGVVGVLDGQTSLADALLEARVGNLRMMVLPAESRVIDSGELIASRAMTKMLQEIKRNFPSHIVIMDLPPLLSSDDVIALLPQIDCILLIAAVGTSTISEIKESNRHLQSSAVLRIVLNKASEPAAGHYYGQHY